MASMMQDTVMEESNCYRYLNKVFPKHDIQEDFEVDIVAVHGLDTSSPRTWIAYERDGPPDTRGRAFNWLSDDDMLPAIVPKARIWTFDYNANYHSNASVVDLLALGEMLLRSILEVRKGTPTTKQVLPKPLIFIGSCFGGLVVVKALESAGSFQSEFADILQATTGIVFLGAPLRGTRAANAARWRVMLAGIRGHEASDTLIKDLDQNANVLKNLIQIFSTMAITPELRLKITCFYETRKTKILNAVLSRSVTQFLPYTQEMLVGQESACIDGHDQIPLNVRHTMMNKYRGPHDQNFLLVSNRIKCYVLESRSLLQARASNPSTQTQTRSEWQPTEKQLECHRSLRTSDYESYKERNPDRVDGTCQWFLEHPHYQYWSRSTTSSLLWVSADPGCGKSVLAKSLVARELLSTETHTTCYFFFKDDSIDQRSATNALCALLHQLFEQRKPLIKYAMSDFSSNGIHLSGLFERLWIILKQATADPEAGTVICIIDALDECEESGRTRLLRFLDRFYNTTTNSDRRNTALKFLVTSRPYFHIERDLESLVSRYPVIRLAGEEETQSISRDINLVIKIEVQKLGHMLKLDDSVRLILEEELLRFINRTYLWVHLILEEIRRRLESVSKTQIREILSTVPGTLDQAYSAILERSENKKSAKKLLHIIVSAIRPLTLREMNAAMAMKNSCTSYDDLDLVPEDQWKTIVRNLCGLFVNVIGSRIYLIHQTAREFLLFSCNSFEPVHDESYAQGWKHSLKLEESNLILARICIWYLLFTVFEVEPLILKQKFQPLKRDVLDYTNRHPFLEYAAEYWASHFREAKDVTDIELLQSVSFKICDTQSSRFSTWFQVYWTRSNPYESYPCGLDSLMVGSYLGLEAVVQLLLRQGFGISSQGDLYRTALSWAAKSGYVAVVKLLLERYTSSNVKSGGRFPLKAMAKEYKAKIKPVFTPKVDLSGTNKFTQPSLPRAEPVSYHTARIKSPQQRISINSADTRGQTPLILAAEGGHTRVIELLLEHNPDMDCVDQFKKTALLSAADNGHEDVVMLLLERTATMKPKSKNLGPVLVSAAGHGQEAVVNLLLDRKVNIESNNNTGQTPLLRAASVGRQHIVKLLLEYNANIEAKDRNGNTPLACASACGSATTVAILLEQEANTEAKNNAGHTPLSLILDAGDKGFVIYWGVFQLLLEHGAMMESKDHPDPMILFEAARYGQVDVVKLLLERNFNIESKEEDSKMTLLSLAAVNGQRNLVEFLLGRNANIEARDHDGQTPLSLAAQYAKDTVVDLLLEHNANMESRDNQGRTPLILAAEGRAYGGHDFPAVVEILLNRGANAEAKDKDEKTPLLLAVTAGNAGVVELLLEHNVRTDCKDGNGQTPLLLAEHLGDKAIITLLLEYNADVSSQRNWARTPLSEAAERGHKAVVKQLLGQNPDIEAKDDIFGQSPLLWAAENGHKTIVKLLLECNAQIESRNHYGQTSLWLAARYGHFRVVKLLVKRNAILDSKDNFSRTPMSIAASHQHYGVEKLLKDSAIQESTVRTPT